MNHIRTYHYYWHIFFFSLLVCMTEFTKAADRGVLERVIYLAKSKGTVYTLLGKVSEQSGFLFVYDSKVVDNDRTVKLGAGQRTIRQAVYEIIGRQDISLHIVENHILINQLQVQCPVVTTSKDTLAYFTLEGKLQDNQSGAPIAYGTVGVVGTSYREGVRYKQKFRNLTEAVFKIYKPSPLLNHFQDHVKLLKMSRIVNSQERDTLIAKISAGIDACLQLDIVKNLPDFLLPDDKGNVYSYASCDMTVIDNRLVNVISFRQNKGIKEPLYCGELYIDAENNALVQARLEINPAYVRQATDMFIERKTRKWKITAQEVVYTISYRQWNGIYYMNHIRGDLYFKVKLKRQWFSSSSLHTWFEMVTCKVDTDNVTRFQRKERMPTRTIFSDTHFKYDADFWGEFNVIPWEEELGTVIEKLSSKIEQIEY